MSMRPKRRRGPGEERVEDVDQHQRQPEVGERSRQQAVVVGRGAEGTPPVARAGDAERDADGERQQQAEGDQLEGGGEALGQVRR